MAASIGLWMSTFGMNHGLATFIFMVAVLWHAWWAYATS
jgi:hypothetical protein